MNFLLPLQHPEVKRAQHSRVLCLVLIWAASTGPLSSALLPPSAGQSLFIVGLEPGTKMSRPTAAVLKRLVTLWSWLTFKTYDLYWFTFLLRPTGLFHQKFHQAPQLLMCCGWAVTRSRNTAGDRNSKPKRALYVLGTSDRQVGAGPAAGRQCPYSLSLLVRAAMRRAQIWTSLGGRSCGLQGQSPALTALSNASH